MVKQRMTQSSVAPHDHRSIREKLRVPTSVLYGPRTDTDERERDRPLAGVRDQVSQIPGARLTTLTSAGITPWHSDSDPEEIARALEDFLAPSPTSTENTASMQGFRTLLFTDLESSTALTQALGDDAAQEVLRGHNESVRAALAANDGSEMKHTGDGIMASFSSAVSAVAAALQIQRDRPARAPPRRLSA